MQQPIMRDPLFLRRKARPATPAELPAADDLLETLLAHKDGCVGMAANMIGVDTAIIAFQDGEDYTVLFNPKIVQRSGPYVAQEGCLSLDGQRPAKRCRKIKVQYQNRAFQTRVKTYTGWTAQIIQHELDHLAGILI